MKLTMTFLVVFLGTYTFGGISSTREIQLDSIVTNIERNTLRNLDSLHKYLHNSGRTTEERVFLYFGLISIHYKYDDNRKRDNNAKEYTPYYTAYRKGGVCRDFAALYKELCDRSDIPCIIAIGRVKVPFYTSIKEHVFFISNRPNHAWNIVKYNDSWHIMDPTWTWVYATEKYYSKSSEGHRKYIGKVKRVDRTYYDIASEKLYAERKVNHPAFYIASTIPSYRTAQKKKNKQIIIDSNYQFASTLERLSADSSYVFNREFNFNASKYSKTNTLNYYLNFYWKFLKLKRSKYNPLTIEECNAHLIEFEAILKQLNADLSLDFSIRFTEHKKEVARYKERLSRKLIVENK